MKQYDIFLSYSNEDSELAKDLKAGFDNAGLDTFMAKIDIKVADIWKTKTRNALKNSKQILLLVTPHSIKSHWLHIEAGAAWVLEKDIIPALQQVDIENLVEPIKQHQARKIESMSQIKGLIKELSKDGSVNMPNITGKWIDPEDKDIVYFRQIGNNVVGFYDLNTKKKVGIYMGELKGRTFNYLWKWLDKDTGGFGEMTIMTNNKKLKGEYWEGDDKNNPSHVGYKYLNETFPEWLTEEDFKEYQDFLNEG